MKGILGPCGLQLPINPPSPFSLPSVNAANRKGWYCHCHLSNNFIFHDPSPFHLCCEIGGILQFLGVAGSASSQLQSALHEKKTSSYKVEMKGNWFV